MNQRLSQEVDRARRRLEYAAFYGLDTARVRRELDEAFGVPSNCIREDTLGEFGTFRTYRPFRPRVWPPTDSEEISYDLRQAAWKVVDTMRGDSPEAAEDAVAELESALGERPVRR